MKKQPLVEKVTELTKEQEDLNQRIQEFKTEIDNLKKKYGLDLQIQANLYIVEPKK